MGKLVFTGGGTAGHVTPNLALLPPLREMGTGLLYIGSKNGMEKALAEGAGIPYEGISTGKLRRYLSLENLKDPFRTLKGIGEARRILKRFRPDVVFSKGGFVSVPVVLAAWTLKIPVILHESDLTPGLANKISLPFAKKILVNFEEALRHLPKKAYVTGTPIREELFQGDAEKGRSFLSLKADDRKLLLIMGGSSGSEVLNGLIRKALPSLLPSYQIVHLTGKGRRSEEAAAEFEDRGYRQVEYLHGELKDVLKAADAVISRSGANAIMELLSLHKPMLLIPLSKKASRGDQILNARAFEKKGFALVREEEELSEEAFLSAVSELDEKRESLTEAMKASPLSNGREEVMKHLRPYL